MNVETKEPVVQEALDRGYGLFGERCDFTGIDYGRHWVDGAPTKTHSLRLTLNPDLACDNSAANDFPSDIDGIPLDVQYARYRAGRGSGPARHRRRQPFQVGGLSGGRSDGTTGTLGLLVIDRASQRPGVLSNWHVLAGADAEPGDEILQPGALDGGRPGIDGIAALQRWMLDTDGDAAVALLNPGTPWLPLQAGTFLSVTGLRRPKLGEMLVKSGRGSAVSRATVDGVGIYRLWYETRPGHADPRDIAGFKLVAEETDDETPQREGDSGAVWMSETDHAGLGLHFADELTTQSYLACHLDTVLNRLELDLPDMARCFDLAPVQRVIDDRPSRDPVPVVSAGITALPTIGAQTGGQSHLVPTIFYEVQRAVANFGALPVPNDIADALPQEPELGQVQEALAAAIARHPAFVSDLGLMIPITAEGLRPAFTYTHICKIIDHAIRIGRASL